MYSIQILLKTFLIHTKDYCDNSSIHGLRYITENGRHITERIFWSIICIAAVYASYKLTLASWYNFQNNAVSFVVETSYLEWNTTFPAVTICENEAPDKIFESGERLYGEDRNMNIDFYLRDIIFFDGSCLSCSTHCGVSVNCTEDFQKLVKEVRAPCDKFLDSCMWNGQPFDCCSYFLPIITEMGVCYTLNSIHTKGNKLDLTSNRATGPGRVDFILYEAARVYIHAPEDVPNINHPQEEKAVLNWGTIFTMLFQVNEIENDRTLREVSVAQRNCRFPKENILKTYNYYSYSACVVDCRAKAQIDFCNCTHHFMPKIPGVATCTLSGLTCLTRYSEILRALRTKDSDKKGLVCDCMPSCVEPEYTVISKVQTPNTYYNDEHYGSRISIVMDTLPTQRFKRNVVRTRLDLVVSIGGTTGLFLGASLLSTAELVYFMFLRKKIVSKNIKEISKSGKNSSELLISRSTRNKLDTSKFVTMQRNRLKNNNHIRFYPFIS